jgi:hypothetical protein
VSAVIPSSVIGGTGVPVIPSAASLDALLTGVRRDIEQLQAVVAHVFSGLTDNLSDAGASAVSAAVTDPPVVAAATATTGYKLFTIYNLTTTAMTLIDINAFGLPLGSVVNSLVLGPVLGTVIDPGGKLTLQIAAPSTVIKLSQAKPREAWVANYFRAVRWGGAGDIVFTFKDSQGTTNVLARYYTHFELDGSDNDLSAVCDSTNCVVAGDDRRDDSSRTVFLLGFPGNRAIDASTLPSARQQQFAALCSTGGVKCTWIDSSIKRTLGQAQVVGAVVENPLDEKTSFPVTVSVAKSTSTSFKAATKAGFDLFSVVKAEVSAEYTKQWTDTYTLSQTVNVPLPAKTAGWVEARIPVDLVTGTLLVQTSGQTIYLRNISVEIPIQDGIPVYTIRNRPLPASALPRTVAAAV